MKIIYSSRLKIFFPYSQAVNQACEKVEVPEEFDEEWFRREIEEFSKERIRKLVLLNAWNKLMKGAKNLEEEEIIELSREIKRGVLKKLKERGFL